MWTVVSTALLVLRLSSAAQAKVRGKAVRSWLSEIGQTVGERDLAVRVFAHAAPAARKT